MKVSQEEKFEFEQLQLEQTKIEAEKELKTHETEMQAKARSTSHTKQGNIPSIKLLKLELDLIDTFQMARILGLFSCNKS